MAFKFHRRTRFKYWADSKLVRFLSGTPAPKPGYGVLKTEEDIEDFLKFLSKKEPFFKTVASNLQNIVMFPSDLYYSIRIYFRNCKGNTHVLDGGLEKGQWYDLYYRIPQCLFYELDKFITKEKGLKTHKREMEAVLNEQWGVPPDSRLYGTKPKQSLDAIEQNEIWEWWKENKDRAVDFDEETEMLVRLIKIRHTLWT